MAQSGRQKSFVPLIGIGLIPASDMVGPERCGCWLVKAHERYRILTLENHWDLYERTDRQIIERALRVREDTVCGGII